MGHQCSHLLSRCSGLPPGEFDFVAGYQRFLAGSGDATSSSAPPRLGYGSDDHPCRGEEDLSLRLRQRRKTPAERQLITSALRSSCVFKTLQSERLAELVDLMEYYECNLGDVLIDQGSTGSYFFVSPLGGFDLLLNGFGVKTLSAGDSFGELALLEKCPHSTSVVAARSKAGVWAGKATAFREVVLTSIAKQVAEIRSFLERVPMLQSLTPRQLDCVADMSSMEAIEAGHQLLSRESENGCVFFVVSGELRKSPSPGQAEEVFTSGNCLGERLLLYGDTSRASVRVSKRTVLIRVNATKFRQLIGKQVVAVKLQQTLITSSFRQSEHFVAWSTSEIASLAQFLELREFMPGTKMPSTIGMFIVLDGSVQVGVPPTAQWLRPGQLHGPPDSLSAAKRGTLSLSDLSSLEAVNEAQLIAGHTGCSLAVLPANMRRGEIVNGSRDRLSDVLSRVSVFRHLPLAQLDLISQKSASYVYRKGDPIVRQGDKHSRFFIVACGKVDVIVNGQSIRRLGANSCFGERAFLFDEPSFATIRVASAEAEVLFPEKSSLSQVSHQLLSRAQLQDTSIKLRDLCRLGDAACGTSGRVWLVRHKESGLRYALKKMQKVDGKVPAEVQQEIQVLSENDHPFLMHMVKSVETPHAVYVLGEYVSGGELHAAMRAIPTVLSRTQAMFYVGSLLLMLETLQERNIVHRDLKPENVMLDDKGYLKLIDFGTAKKLEVKGARTFTMVGTTHYMAPEVMRGRGYGVEVDVWALGIVLYELVVGSLPFGEKAETTREVCKEVLAGKVHFPDDLEVSVKSLVMGLLEQRPRRRLGCGPEGLQEIKAAPFFDVSNLHQDANSNGFGDSHVKEARATKNTKFFSQLTGRELEAPVQPTLQFAYSNSLGESISDAEEAEDCCYTGENCRFTRKAALHNG